MHPIISILMASIRKESLVCFLDNLEATLYEVSACEVLIKIDTEDLEMINFVKKEKKARKLTIKFIVTPKEEGYWTLWKAYNAMVSLASPYSYFFMGLNDGCGFETHGWDKILKTYIGSFKDDIFHLRLSHRRNFKFPWLVECIPCGESFGCFTRKWIELTEGWAIGPAGGDTGQECVNYFLREHYGCDRGIPIADISMLNEEESISPSAQLTNAAWEKKLHGIYNLYIHILNHTFCYNYFVRLAHKLYSEIQTTDKTLEPKPILSDNPDDFFVQWLLLINKIRPICEQKWDWHGWVPLVVSNLVARRVLAHKWQNFQFSEKNIQVFKSYCSAQRCLLSFFKSTPSAKSHIIEELFIKICHDLGYSKDSEFLGTLKMSLPKLNPVVQYLISMLYPQINLNLKVSTVPQPYRSILSDHQFLKAPDSCSAWVTKLKNIFGCFTRRNSTKKTIFSTFDT